MYLHVYDLKCLFYTVGQCFTVYFGFLGLGCVLPENIMDGPRQSVITELCFKNCLAGTCSSKAKNHTV
jgi:hypothetical protein